MDTRDQTLTKLTRLHGKSHPTHHRPASLRWNYSRTAVSIMKLVMEDGWWWRRRRFPLSGAQNGLQICPPDEVQDVAAPLYRKRDAIFSLDFFLDESELIKLRLGAAEPCGPHKLAHRNQGVEMAGLVAHWPTPWGGLGADIFLFSKTSPRKFPRHLENFGFCTKMTPRQFCWKQR